MLTTAHRKNIYNPDVRPTRQLRQCDDAQPRVELVLRVAPGVRIVVALAFLAAIIWHTDGLSASWQVIRKMTWLPILVVIIAFTIDRALMTYKWIRLLRVQGLNLPFFKGLQMYCASMVWGFFLPATVGPDAIRAICARRAGLSTSKVIASILIERVLGFLATPFIALASMILLRELGGLDPRLAPAWCFGAALLFGTLVVFLASLSETVFNLLYTRVLARFAQSKAVRMLRDIHATYRAYRETGGELVLFSLLTVLEQLLAAMIFWLIAWGMNVHVSLLQMTAAVSIAFLVSRLPISIGGLGVFEAVFVLILSAFGVAAEESFSVAVVGRLLHIVSWLPWWLAYVVGTGSLKEPRGRCQ